MSGSYPGGPAEHYARIFSYQANGKFLPIIENEIPGDARMFNQPYFNCAKNWAQSLVDGASGPSTVVSSGPSASEHQCTDSIPSWYHSPIDKP